MKFLLFVSCFIIAALALDNIEDEKTKAEEYVKACTTETGISEESANKLKIGDFSVRDQQAQVCLCFR
jgi:hypothetical protein